MARPRSREFRDDFKIAVLFEPGMAVIGGTPSLPESRMLEMFDQLGLPSAAVNVEQASDPEYLNTDRYRLIVMPYGNAFPANAYENIRRFHADGGGMILNGIPFCHPCDKSGSSWQSTGHTNDFFTHDYPGIGTGGFVGADTAGELRVVPDNPLGIRQEMLPRERDSLQCLRADTLSPDDTVIPLVELDIGDRRMIATALVVHACSEFHGAANLWIGQVAQDSELEDRYFAEQLVARGAAWILHNAGVIADERLKEVYARMDSVSRPEPAPTNLEIIYRERPWGDSFLPKSVPPARNLKVVDCGPLSKEERLALICLQGITSRAQPRLWLNISKNDDFWLDWHVERGHLDGYELVEDWTGLFRHFSDEIKGVVIPDDELYCGEILAINVASCEDLIVGSEELADRLALEVVIDLRGRFDTFAEGLEWVWNEYRDDFSPHITSYSHPNICYNGSLSYLIQWKGLVFWISGGADRNHPGADMLAEKRLVSEVFSTMPPNSSMLGFPGTQEMGLGEVEGVNLCSRYGMGLICSDYLTNVPVTSGIYIDELHPPQTPPAPKLDHDKMYIAMAISDGDNLNAWRFFFKENYFDRDGKRDFPMAWAIGPPAIDLQPVVMEWFYERMPPGDEVLADVSGMFYMMPHNFAEHYRDRDRVYRENMRWLDAYMRRMGMRTVRTHGGGDQYLKFYAEGLNDIHSLFADMGGYGDRAGYEDRVYALDDGTYVFRAITTWRYGRDSFWRDIEQRVGDTRPAFINGFVHCWTYDSMEELHTIYDQRHADAVFVSPSQLSDLYRQYLEGKGGE